ncbi:MAG: bifunctional phosphoribosylaminoimidazolecarboxamide formyltransferase/IMP cyclohydrolase [Bacteroidales bacterium]|nr:bifunctional phosphoribosylaminoimidazolecarboxamide formyltransferase/IMP cyclohydrolase [Bacteroidales bacterium]MCF8337594.1 bifunctional phosphoribosylaminoimidazolecarboxamide formyltransferase/IMP cyclohydrolase [Bacteroidales bacterium]
MAEKTAIQRALISVYHKKGLDPILKKLHALNVELISTGGTYEYITQKGYNARRVEDLTSYPSILGDRVKTLHPKIFGGLLAKQEKTEDQQDIEKHEILPISLIVVDLYPFETTLETTSKEDDIIEKIDIGGISLIRAAAKNYEHVLTISSMNQYDELLNILENNEGKSTLKERRRFATEAFAMSSHYDTAIFNYFNRSEDIHQFRHSESKHKPLRYGENPHQNASFYGDLENVFTQLHGKEISYNNLLDIDAGINLIQDFGEDPTFAIVKHNNACGVAIRPELPEAWKDALAGDPISAFGGILITNTVVDEETAKEIHKVFFEVILAPGYDKKALDILKQKKKRVILKKNNYQFPKKQFRSLMNGVIEQDRDLEAETDENLQPVTDVQATEEQIEDLIFANNLVKHAKSNAIVLAKNKQLLASGIGQTSRVDALKQAIDKARHFNHNLQEAVMASDGFFPFADSVEIAKNAGITAIIQPGGSIRDQESIDYCNENGLAMVFTGVRHFKH